MVIDDDVRRLIQDEKDECSRMTPMVVTCERRGEAACVAAAASRNVGADKFWLAVWLAALLVFQAMKHSETSRLRGISN